MRFMLWQAWQKQILGVLGLKIPCKRV